MNNEPKTTPTTLDENERELLRMIRESKDPGQALIIAIETILEVLAQRKEPGAEPTADSSENA